MFVSVKDKVKVKVWTLAIVPLTWVRLVTSSALQYRKWQLIGISQWCRSTLCGHSLPVLADSWTHSAASKHTIAPVSHTRPSLRSRSYYSFPVPLRVGGWVGLSTQYVSSLLKVACSGPGVIRTCNLLVTCPILYQLDRCTHRLQCLDTTTELEAPKLMSRPGFEPVMSRHASWQLTLAVILPCHMAGMVTVITAAVIMMMAVLYTQLVSLKFCDSFLWNVAGCPQDRDLEVACWRNQCGHVALWHVWPSAAWLGSSAIDIPTNSVCYQTSSFNTRLSLQCCEFSFVSAFCPLF